MSIIAAIIKEFWFRPYMYSWETLGKWNTTATAIYFDSKNMHVLWDFLTRKQFCNISVCDYRRSSAVGIVTTLRAGQTRVRIRVRAIDFCLLQNVQTGSGANPASYSMGTGVLFPGLIYILELRTLCMRLAVIP